MVHSIVEDLTPVRLSCAEKRGILEAVQSLESRIPGFKWWTIGLFGSRIDVGARGGDIDLYIRVDRVPSVAPSRLKRELRIALGERLGEQKFDLVIDDGETDLGAFGSIVLQEKVDLWRRT